MLIRVNVNDMKYIGTCPKISVWFGDNGQIIGYASLWRELEPFLKYPIISLDSAVEKIKSNNALIYGIEENASEILLENAELILYSDAEGMNQEYITPHYLMIGKSKGGRPFTAIKRTISDSYLNEVMLNYNNIISISLMKSI